MKKIIAIICVVISVLSMSACSNSKEDYMNVSKIENYYFIGESENFKVTLTSGQSENPMIINGDAGKLMPQSNLTVEVKSGYSDKYTYQIAVGEEGFSGDLKEEIVGGNLTAEFAISELPELSYKVLIMHNGKTEEVVLESVITDDMIKWNEAKAIANKELSKNIAEMQSEVSDNFEVYIKFVYDKENKSGSWYVAYANEEKLCAVLISPTSGKVIAKRV